MSRPNSAWIFKAASIITAGYPCSPVALSGMQEATGEGNEMNKFMAILGLAVIPLLSPPVGKAQSVTVFRPSPFKIDKLSARTDGDTTWVYGEITNNAKKAASTVYILVRWFDKAQRVIAHYTTSVTDLAPGQTLPFRASAKKDPDIIRYDVAIERVRFADHQDFPSAASVILSMLESATPVSERLRLALVDTGNVDPAFHLSEQLGIPEKDFSTDEAQFRPDSSSPNLPSSASKFGSFSRWVSSSFSRALIASFLSF
jgi:hypothetical protein